MRKNNPTNFLAATFLRGLSILSISLAIAVSSGFSQEADSEVEKRLAAHKREFKDAYVETVEKPFKTLVADLNAKYVGALERQLQAATKAGNLDEAVELRDEKALIASVEGVPESDDDSTSDSLKSLRATYRTQLAALEAERGSAATRLIAKHDASLAAYQTLLTREGKLDEALLAQSARETLSKEAADSPAGNQDVVEHEGRSMVGKGEQSDPPENFTAWLLTVEFVSSLGDRTHFLGDSTLFIAPDGKRFTYRTKEVSEEDLRFSYEPGAGNLRTIQVSRNREEAEVTFGGNQGEGELKVVARLPDGEFTGWLATVRFDRRNGESYEVEGGKVLHRRSNGTTGIYAAIIDVENRAVRWAQRKIEVKANLRSAEYQNTPDSAAQEIEISPRAEKP